jgi:PAS domain S-box-containing protein
MNANFRRITDAIPQTIVVLDPSGAPLYANQATLDFTGLSAEDVFAPHFRKQIFHSEDLDKSQDERRVSVRGDCAKTRERFHEGCAD